MRLTKIVRKSHIPRSIFEKNPTDYIISLIQTYLCGDTIDLASHGLHGVEHLFHNNDIINTLPTQDETALLRPNKIVHVLLKMSCNHFNNDFVTGVIKADRADIL